MFTRDMTPKQQRITQTAQRGFTLIELVSVLVVIGVLAAVALPRFFDLRRSAIIATMHGIDGAIESAASMSYAQAIVEGVHEEANATITVGSDSIDLVYGYPAGTATGIARLIQYPPSNWQSRASTFAGAWVYWHGAIEEDAGVANCYVRYRQSVTVNTRPVINFVSTGC